MEEKYKSKRGDDEEDGNSDDDSTTSEEEDDEGFLVTEDLDAEISATLQAIKSKDPRVYDEKVTFFKPIEEQGDDDNMEIDSKKPEKPMYLRDYHRENLLKGYNGDEDKDQAPAPRTYVQEQEDLKKSIVQEMHAAGNDEEDEEEEEYFLTAKRNPEPIAPTGDGIHPSRTAKVVSKVEVDVAIADKDPELFLSNFMAARAWVPQDDPTFQPFESDDEEEDKREEFEVAYNMRYEDPENSNEVLKSYSRDIVAKRSVRREEPKGRKKLREIERERKDAAKRERDEERARLRKLKIEQMEEKLQKIKKTAGISGKALKDEDWAKFFNEAWDDDKWEEEMNKRFGEDYYAGQEAASDEASDEEQVKTKKPKKPKWDDDIDIKDLVPEFEAEEEAHKKPAFTLSDSEEEAAMEEEDDDDEATRSTKTKSSSRTHQAAKAERKNAARLERKRIEDLVDAQLNLDPDIVLPSSSKNPNSAPAFRYRETSPTTFGLTARDILLAPSDAALNEFVGLKKLATFRDAEKKRKDRKRLGKKARLREWRKAVFGNEDGPVVEDFGVADTEQGRDETGKVDVVEASSSSKKKKKKRSRKNNKGVDGVEA